MEPFASDESSSPRSASGWQPPPRPTTASTLALALSPSPDPAEVAARQALTTEAIGLLEESLEPPLEGIRDVREVAALAARGGVLTAGALRHVADTARGSLRARSALASPLLSELAAAIDPELKPLAEAIDRAVMDDGSDLKDNASPRLRKLRGELRTGRQRVADRLEQLVRKAGIREHLQEDFVTQRGGRPVLAVKASSRSSVPGLVHDSSDSGQTLFVEPFEIVELSNRQSEAAGAEREEAERILRELSAAVAGAAGALALAVEAAGRIDLAIALGTVSRGWRGAPVELSDDVRLLGARHPLLEAATAVPIDLDLGDVRALVISGPNTGGKTVALKTLGLAALLHQSGLRPPAESAALPVFDQVLADIGDRQSIEMSLSTFSGHVANLVAILNAARERSLVLLDEVAAGTDPVEGSALAQALLARLADQARLTVVTTHYSELKEWASTTDGVVNAGTGIDPETHAPLYRIVLGRPGISHALEIAERLGLDAGVVGDARGRVAPERLRIQELLARGGGGRARRRDRARGRGARALRRRGAARVAAGARGGARSRGRVGAGIGGRRARSAPRTRHGATSPPLAPSSTRSAARSGRHDGDGATSRSATAASARRRSARRGRSARSAPSTSRCPTPGRSPPAIRSRRRRLGVHGTIAAIDGDEAEVVGPAGHRLRVPLARLRPSRQREPEAETPVRVVVAASADISDELDVRGQRAQEAREAVRAFVDDAALAGLPSVRVIHGRGTGAVRTAVRDELDRHPLVEARESDSADGATVVHLNG